MSVMPFDQGGEFGGMGGSPDLSNYDPYGFLGGVDENYRPRIGTYYGREVAGGRTGEQNKGRFLYAPPRPAYGQARYTEANARQVFSMKPNQVLELQARLSRAGFLSTMIPRDPYSTFSAYRTALSAANLAGMPIKEYLDEREGLISGAASGMSGSSGGYGGGGGGSSSSTFTSSSSSSDVSNMTTRSINLTGKGQAESLLRTALLQQLGRVPTDDEVSRFKRLLNQQERKNPTVTKSSSKSNTSSTTTTTTKGQSSSSSTSSRTSGSSTSTTKQSDIDPSEEALDFAQSKQFRKERKMYQDLNYYNVLADMIGM